MNRFVLKNTFIKVYMYHFFDKYFYKNKESKLGFGDRVVVLNDFLYGYGGSTRISITYCETSFFFFFFCLLYGLYYSLQSFIYDVS